MKTSRWIAFLGLTVFLVFAGASAFSAQEKGESHQHNSTNKVEKITIDQVLGKMQQGESIVFVDSRKKGAWEQADNKIPGAIRVGNNDQLRQLVKELPKDQFTVVYCT